MLYKRILYYDYSWEMDIVSLFPVLQWLDFSFTAVLFYSSDICLAEVVSLQVGRFAYERFFV